MTEHDDLAVANPAFGVRLDPERLVAVLEGRNDPGYNPPDFPLLQGYDETERGRDH